MLIARWIILFIGLAACVSAALFLLTRKPMYWVLAKRIFVTGVAVALIFFGVLLLERLAVAI
jgi:hypothetical protein